MTKAAGATPPEKGEGHSVEKWSSDWWWDRAQLWGKRLFALSIIFGTIAAAAAWGVSCYVQPDLETLGDRIGEVETGLREELGTEIEEVKTSLTSSIEATRSELHDQIDEVSDEISEIQGLLLVIRDLVTPGRSRDDADLGQGLTEPETTGKEE